jgi:uroporphyrinogen decarboxylase
MTHRERVLTALEHREPDRVPIDLGSTWVSTMARSTHEALKRHLKLGGGDAETAMLVLQTARVDERILRMFDTDFRPLYPGAPVGWSPKYEDNNGYTYFEDEWGIGWKMPKEGGYYFDMVNHPLRDASLETIKRYKGPDVHDPGRVDGLAESAKKLMSDTDYAVFPEIGGPGMFEGAWFLRGMEQFMVDMVSNKALAGALLDKVLQIMVGFYGVYLDEIGDVVDIVPTGDDLGGQRGPLMRPDLYRELIKPRQRELISFIKSKTKAKIFFHICGDFTPFLDDLIEVGVDIVNPVQLTALNMDAKTLKENWGDRVVFWGGGCDTQRVLPFGSEDEVVLEVRQRIGELAPGGGFVFSQVHDIQANTPPQNIVAMLDAALEFGKYPIKRMNK